MPCDIPQAQNIIKHISKVGTISVQELLRHANSRITLDVYTQAVNSTKRAAQSKVVRMMVPGVGKTGVETYPRIAQ
jgi:hypothetical protein